MSKRVDLSLLVPDYLYENQRFKELLEVVEDFIIEALDNVDDLNDLWQMWRRDLGEVFEYIDALIDLVWVEAKAVSDKDLLRIFPNIKSFVDRKSTYEFLRAWLTLPSLFSLLSEGISEIVILSSQRELSCGFRLQDGREWRDAVIKMDVDTSYVSKGMVEQLSKIFPVGVLWLVKVVFLLVQLLKGQFSLKTIVYGDVMFDFEVSGYKDTYMSSQVTSLGSNGFGSVSSWDVRNYSLVLVDEYVIG